jgi:hypothetical protein
MSGHTPDASLVHWVGEHWVALLTFFTTVLGSFGFVYWTLKKTIPDLLDRMKKLEEATDNEKLNRRIEEMGFAKREHLIDDKGIPIYQLVLSGRD